MTRKLLACLCSLGIAVMPTLVLAQVSTATPTSAQCPLGSAPSVAGGPCIPAATPTPVDTTMQSSPSSFSGPFFTPSQQVLPQGTMLPSQPTLDPCLDYYTIGSACVSPPTVQPEQNPQTALPHNNPDQFPVSKQEIRDFTTEFRNIQNDAQRILKDLSKAKNTDELKKAIAEALSGVLECVNQATRGTNEEKRETMNDCRSRNYGNDINDVRQQFVPPQEIKNELSQIKQQLRDLLRHQKQLAKAGNSKLADTMIAEIKGYQEKITNLFGQDQRDVLEDYRNARYWDEINKVRAMAEIPRNISGSVKDIKSLDKYVGQSSLQKALAFFGVNLDSVKASLTAKKEVIGQINTALAAGDPETAQELMEEHIYQSWNPGDLRHALDMFRESHQIMRFLKDDSEVKEEVMGVLEPISEAFNAGEYQDARDALVQFTNEIRPYRQYFEQSGRPGSSLNSKTRKLLSRLDAAFEEKFQQDARGQ